MPVLTGAFRNDKVGQPDLIFSSGGGEVTNQTSTYQTLFEGWSRLTAPL